MRKILFASVAAFGLSTMVAGATSTNTNPNTDYGCDHAVENSDQWMGEGAFMPSFMEYCYRINGLTPEAPFNRVEPKGNEGGGSSSSADGGTGGDSSGGDSGGNAGGGDTGGNSAGGNPGNDKDVGRAGESPNGKDFGGGSKGRSDSAERG